MTNKLLVAAAAYSVVTAVLHVTGGTSQYATPLPGSALDEQVRFVLLAVWHMSSIAISLSAGALVWCAARRSGPEARQMIIFIASMWIGFGLCFLFVALTEAGDDLVSKLVGPPVLLIPPGILALASQRRRAQPPSANDLPSNQT